MHGRLLIAITVVACGGSVRSRAAGSAPSHHRPALWGDLEPGPFDVGFTELELVDPGRAYGNQAARPVRVSLWFPVERSAGRPAMAFRDYVTIYARPGAVDAPTRYRLHGDPVRAEQRYRASLAVKPANGGAVTGLELLERPPQK